MPSYEITFITRQDISTQDVEKLTDVFANLFKDMGGEIVKREYWGLRNLAYLIRKNRKGHYVMLGVNASAESIKEFTRKCLLNEDIIRHLIVKVDSFDSGVSAILQEDKYDNAEGGDTDGRKDRFSRGGPYKGRTGGGGGYRKDRNSRSGDSFDENDNNNKQEVA